MKSTLSNNKQLFNVKSITTANKNLGQIAEGEFAFINEETNLTVVPTSFANLPAEFRLVSKLNGKIYYGLDTVKKDTISKLVAKEYVAPTGNVWKGIIENCDCSKSVLLQIHINDDELMRRDGFTWTHRDTHFELTPQELECLCDCDGKGVYENHLLTKMLFDKITAVDSAFYTASVETESGTQLADSAAIQSFIDGKKADNTDDDDTNDSEKLVLVIKGKVKATPLYRDIEVNYVYPRGTALTVNAVVNGNVNIAFTEETALGFEIGAGYDMRAEERDCMSLYSDLNHQPRLSDGVAHPNLVYQFENGVNYDTISFEFSTDKVERVGTADTKGFAMVLGAETGSSVSTALKAAFGI